MSRPTTAPRRPGEEDDICPVCKSSRYLNPNMRFLVNPECYHKMCESCVDRIFSQGPAPCPVAGCARTLRKQRFRKQTFEDIQVEREVDIRRRVAQTMNRRPSEFTTLLAYNNYLEEVETLTFNLLHNTNLTTTEQALTTYALQNAPSISHNAQLSAQETASQAASHAAEKERAKLRRQAARQEEEDEKREREQGKREIIDLIASDSTGNAETIARQGQQKVRLKAPAARRTAAEKAHQQLPQHPSNPHPHQNNPATQTSTSNPTTPFLIHGLKPIIAPVPEKPYDPFDGATHDRIYYTLRPSYENPWLEKAQTDPKITAGGYDVREYYARTMLEAFAGLGCFVEEEVAARESVGGGDGVATAGAAVAAGGGDADVF